MCSFQDCAGRGLVILAVALGSTDLTGARADQEYAQYWGMCDASAGVALDEERFMVADDETNYFYIYRHGQSRPALQRVQWDKSAAESRDLSDGELEGDIEGAAPFKDAIFWITSHGRSRSGELRPNRHQFFVVRVARRGDKYVFTRIGRTYRHLATHMVTDPQLQGIGLAESMQLNDRKNKDLAPKRDGFNIEGLAAGPDGSLLIGLRNPRPQGKAVVIRLVNPMAVLTEDAKPEFDPPILLDFGRLGIRDITYSNRRGEYLLITGPHDGGRGAFGIFRWSGKREDAPQQLDSVTAAVAQAVGFAPEALLLSADENALHLLSDDGSKKVAVSSPEECKPGTFDKGYCRSKDLRNAQNKSFRSLTVSVP